jgi:citronellol/citronellal dehydrogenase
MSLAGKTLFITGASRGIGLAIALKAARDGANIVVAAKTAEPHPKLPGTIYTAAEEIRAAGGKALPVIVDVRDEASVNAAVAAAVEAFGGIDICVNNASAISLTGTLETDMKRYDLMHQINLRGTFVVSKACIPHLRKSANPHVLALSPPPDLRPEVFGTDVAYMLSKYGMSLCMMGMANEFQSEGIAFNALWPITYIATAAVRMLSGAGDMIPSRKPEIMADAAYAIFHKKARGFSGQCLLDEFVLRAEGVDDFTSYALDPDIEPEMDLFVSDEAFQACQIAAASRGAR